VSLLFKQAGALGWISPLEGPLRDVRIDVGTVVEIAPQLERRAGEAVWDLAGDRLAPGLHDHHIHLRALCALEASIILGPPEVQTPTELADRLRRAGAHLHEGEWLRAVAYHENVAGPLDREELDCLVPDRPIRVQHASGALWMVNSRALEALRAEEGTPPGAERDGEGRLNGRFWREDEWLGSRLPRSSHDFSSMSQLAAGRGVTGFTDATPGMVDADVVGFVEARKSRTLVQRLVLMAEPGTSSSSGTEVVTLGPSKIILDDITLPPFDELTERIARSHEAGVPVALHCVTRTQAVLAIAVLEQAGVVRGDRIEHGSVLAPDSIEVAARLGLVVVTQPGFIATRGDRFIRNVPTRTRRDLYRLRSLIDAGIAVAGSTDAPFGSPDPWQAIRAAVDRRTLAGAPLGVDEAVSLDVAISLFTSDADAPWRQRRVAPGEVADLCVVSREPWDHLAGEAPQVRATFVAGRTVHSSPS
jgi:predicted amidohydrolase YtcJ